MLWNLTVLVLFWIAHREHYFTIYTPEYNAWWITFIFGTLRLWSQLCLTPALTTEPLWAAITCCCGPLSIFYERISSFLWFCFQICYSQVWQLLFSKCGAVNVVYWKDLCLMDWKTKSSEAEPWTFISSKQRAPLIQMRQTCWETLLQSAVH